jgi:hypothetical protein
VILNPWSSSFHFWFSMCSRIVCSSTAPTVAQKFPRAPRCCPSTVSGGRETRPEFGGVAVLQGFLAVAATPGKGRVGVDVVGAGDEGGGGSGGQGFFGDLAAKFGGTIGAGAAWGDGHEGALVRAGPVSLQKSGLARRSGPAFNYPQICWIRGR